MHNVGNPVQNLVRRRGVPAFAYPAHDASTLWSCKLKIIHRGAEFAISLEHPIDVDGEQQLITLRYEGDNLVPGKMSLEDRGIGVSAELLSKTPRQGNPKLRLLSLMLKKPCSVWYPKTYPKLDMSFQTLLTLARTTKVCIYFDTCWLGENTREFHNIVQGTQEFVGVPLISQFTNLYQEADRQIFNSIPAAEPGACLNEDLMSGAILSIEDVGAEAPPFEDVVHDNPPPYPHDMLGKRSKPDSSLTPDARGLKRAREHSCSFSETELATPTLLLQAESTASSSATVPADLFQETVTCAVKKVFSHMLKEELVQVVKQELPCVVAELFRKTPADHSPSRCLSPASPCNRIPNAPAHQDVTPTRHPTLSVMINKAVATAVHEALDNTLHETLNRHHQTIIIGLDEYSDDLRIDLAASHEDHVVDCNDEHNEMKAKFKQHLVDCLDDFKNFANKMVENRLNKLGDTIGNQAFCGRGDVLVASKQSQRATSLPVSRYDKERIMEGA